MIIHLKHSNIDKQKWNKVVEKSYLTRVYLFSWYLDIVSPNWEALVSDDEYSSFFPLPVKHKFGIKYLVQPLFVQQLGAFGQQYDENFLCECCVYIKKHYLYSNINYNELCFRWLNNSDIHYQTKNNIILNIISDADNLNENHSVSDANLLYEQVRKNYHENAKRNISKFAKSDCFIEYSVGKFSSIIDLYRKNNTKHRLTEQHYVVIEKLVKEAVLQDRLSVVTAVRGNEIVAGAIFLRSARTWTYIFSGNSDYGKTIGAAAAIIDAFIKANITKIDIIDFEGSNDANLAHFYLGFGGETACYANVLRKGPVFIW